MKKFKFITTIIIISILTTSCNSILEEQMFSQLSSDNYLTTKDGLESVLKAGYSRIANMNGNNFMQEIIIEELPTDMLYLTGGSQVTTWAQFTNFTWDATIGNSNLVSQNWDEPYKAILYANTVLKYVDNSNIFSENEIINYKAEARFIRAVAYYKLYFKFGSVPLIKSIDDELYPKRATEEEIQQFIETEFKDVIINLYESGKEPAYGRAHKNAARAFLCLYYLNTKQWQKCSSVTDEIINNGHYTLFPIYEDLFKIENERNSEFIWVRPAKATADRSATNGWMNNAFPPDFYKHPRTGLVFLDTWRNFPTSYRLRDAFYNSFEIGDNRKNLIISEYINSIGDTISLLNDDNTRSFKYWPDPDGINASYGNDAPEFRYAEILLAKAEALNELNGPNQESISLVNLIRVRAGLPKKLLSDFSNKESLRNHILSERGWEFYSEGKRRMDLIRMGKFISSAHERGLTIAQPRHRLFPIPQSEVDANYNLVQNDGY